MKNVAIFCASSFPENAIYAEEAEKLGKMLALSGTGVVYGGTSTGLMDVVASAALRNGGKVTGVITEFLAGRKIVKHECTELITVETLSERKAKMLEISDGVIALPGGCGTLDELFEALTLIYFNLFKYPVGLLNTDGYYDLLTDFLKKSVAEKFMQPELMQKLIIASQVEELLNKMIIL